MSKLHKFDLVFISTFVNLDNINDLVKSICSSSIETNLRILLLLVCQNNLRLKFESTKVVQIECINKSTLLPLSVARNIAIEYVLSQKIEADYIMFPDDDSTFDRNFFVQYANIEKRKNYIVDVYCAGTKMLFKKQSKISSQQLLRPKNWNVACSVNMLISFDSFDKVKFFDEELGVGSRYGAGEDNDYFIRICSISDGFFYNKELYNFHPAIGEVSNKYTLSQLIRRYRLYGMGVAACLCKHRMFFNAFTICLRALIGGMISILSLKFKFGLAYFVSFFFRLKVLLLFIVYCIKSKNI